MNLQHKTTPIFIALIMAIAAISVALISQYFFGKQPCELCIYQRYPYIIAIIIAIISLIAGKQNKWIVVAISLCFLTTSAIGSYHFAVEQGLIAAPETCASASLKSTSLDDLKAAIISAPIINCKNVSASLFGLSMAGWNVIYGIFAIIITGFLWRKQKK